MVFFFGGIAESIGKALGVAKNGNDLDTNFASKSLIQSNVPAAHRDALAVNVFRFAVAETTLQEALHIVRDVFRYPLVDARGTRAVRAGAFGDGARQLRNLRRIRDLLRVARSR